MTLGSARRTLRAVLFDAGNTLVFLDYPRMAAAVGAALGITLTGEQLASNAAEAARAMERAAGNDQHRATAYLEALFLLGGVAAERLSEVRDRLSLLHRERHLWCSVKERTRDSLLRLRQAGFRLGVVSNSDGRAEQALEEAGLRDCFDVVVDSALVGIEKPDPRIFQTALDALGVAPEEALYVGDLYEVDVVGARGAGMDAVLIGSEDSGSSDNCRTVDSIEALVNDLLSGDSA